MTSPINTVPRGLLGLLGVQTGGRTPRDLDDRVYAGFEMFDLYTLADQRELYDATAVITAVLGDYPNVNGILTVPQNELWYVRDFVVEAAIVLAVGENHAVAPAFYTVGPAGAGITPWNLNGHSTFGPGQRPLVRCSDPFWLKAGDRLGLYMTNVVASSSTVAYELKARVSRIAI